MRKIPTVFERDWDGDRSRVLDRVVPSCEWVFSGEGVATQKLDGTCCAVIGGRLFKRQELRGGVAVTAGFIAVEYVAGNASTATTIGWTPVGDGPEDKWYRDALAHRGEHPEGTGLPEGTYELVGPKINGNPEHFDEHALVAHDHESTVLAVRVLPDYPIAYDAFAKWFEFDASDIEGIVWHHPDGRMAKVKGRDFGVKRDG